MKQNSKNAVVEVENLVKKFGEVRAVDGISFKIFEGEIFGLLGPNGAGKTTTIRVLTTLTVPTSGKTCINGCEVTLRALDVKKKIGVVPQQLNLEKELTAWENLELNGMLYGIPKEIRREKIEKLLKYVGLWEKAHVKVEKFSGGMMRRLMIARALMHDPSVLFLDEPTVGLDPQTRRKIWDLIRVMNNEGVTVLLTTHYIEEAEQLCHRVAIIDKGKLIAVGTPLSLKEKIGKTVLEYLENGRTMRLFFSSRTEALKYAENLDKDVHIRETNLEDVFVKLTGEELIEES